MGQSITDSANLGLIPMPFLMAQDVRNMDDGYSLIFSHKEKGPVRAYCPWPGDLHHLRDIIQLNPGG